MSGNNCVFTVSRCISYHFGSCRLVSCKCSRGDSGVCCIWWYYKCYCIVQTFFILYIYISRTYVTDNLKETYPLFHEFQKKGGWLSFSCIVDFGAFDIDVRKYHFASCLHHKFILSNRQSSWVKSMSIGFETKPFGLFFVHVYAGIGYCRKHYEICGLWCCVGGFFSTICV